MKPLILFIEGLASSYLERSILARLQREHKGKFEYILCGWNNVPRIDRPLDLIISHSLGGETGLRIASQWPALKALITLDPRRNNLASVLDFLLPFPLQPPFKAPERVKCINFYRNNLFMVPGVTVSGAENIRVSGVSHTALPFQDIVFDRVVRELGL